MHTSHSLSLFHPAAFPPLPAAECQSVLCIQEILYVSTLSSQVICFIYMSLNTKFIFMTQRFSKSIISQYDPLISLSSVNVCLCQSSTPKWYILSVAQTRTQKYPFLLLYFIPCVQIVEALLTLPVIHSKYV